MYIKNIEFLTFFKKIMYIEPTQFYTIFEKLCALNILNDLHYLKIYVY